MGLKIHILIDTALNKYIKYIWGLSQSGPANIYIHRIQSTAQVKEG